MSTPTIVRKVSNLANNNNNNTDNTNSPTTTSSPPIRPTRVVRVLSKSAALASTTTGTTTDNASTTTPTTQQQQPTTSTVDHPPPTTTNSIEHNDTPDNTSSTESNGTTTKKVIKRVIVRRPAGEAASNSIATTTTTTTTTSDNNNTINNNNTTTSQTPPVNNINNTITTTNNNTTTTTTASTKEPTTQPSSTTKETTTTNNEVNSTTTSTPITPRSNVADRWLKNNTAATTITTEQPPTPVRRVINRNSLKQDDKQNTPVIVPSTTSTPTPTTTPTPSATTENKNINSTSSQFGTKLVSAANKSHSTIDTTTSTPPVNGSPHQTSKSMNDVPETKSVKDLITKLTPNLKVFTPEQLMNDKKSVGGSDNIRPLRPLEIATWYGGSVSVATEDPKFDNSSIEDLKKEAPDVYYTNYLFNPLFDEQSACDTPTINMSAQEILQYNFVVELMRKKHTNLLTLDPIVFEEEMKNASSLSSLTLSRTLSSTHTRTDSVTSSTEDVLSREDIGYPINKCSKNWKYQLKKKKENAKNNFNPNDGMFTPRASVQLQSSSPSSPATLNSTPVNPLYDHLYYMPCWKHQLQIDQIVKRGGDQKKVQ